ncbi:hypothetical protein PMG11_11360 [Penicillium brasilianum]|uniref:Uncharacterized protein n=1 Tax=Penicillium brasilianum TaxID=104259 RepID=A0A0F7U514_PENBI|nr:hypothetical protein PMG11_11360 [Penicillium brasilianum]
MESFPNELFSTSSLFCREPSIRALAQTNGPLYSICSPCLYHNNVLHGNNTALAWEAEHGNIVTLQKASDAGAPLPASSGPGPTTYGPVVNAYGKIIRERVYQDFPTRLASLAAKGGHEEMLRFTLLALAAIHDHTSLVRFLLSQGARHNIRSHGSHCPMWRAAFHGDEEIVALLPVDVKKRWADGFIEQIQDGLWAAMIGGHQSGVQYLVERHDAAVNWYYGSSNIPTLILRAAKDGRADIVRVLLQLGAEVNGGSLPSAARI